MQLAIRRQPFDGRDLGAPLHDGKREARKDTSSVDEHRAGAALTVVAALLGSGEAEIFAKSIEQGSPRPKLHAALDAIYAEGHLELRCQTPLGWLVSRLRFPLHCLTPKQRRATPKRPSPRLVPRLFGV